ncbi:MAG: isoprenyl transferase [Candidatus Latescibacteria bacterium]|nr:isoprenyl transferase [Candidatus Latescibacterota bacterium]
MKKNFTEDRKKVIKKGALPKHVAIIMDGNGRWAKSRGLKRIDGHRAGIDTVRRIVRLAGEIGIGYMTLYTFSSENWNRPPGEIRGLMEILAQTLEKEIPELHENGVRLQTIGDISALPKRSRDALYEAVEATSKNTGLTLVLALNYGGRDEIVRAIKSIARNVRDGQLNPDNISYKNVESALYTAGIPDPDLLIRTSGEFRLSNFLLWQLAYTELWITDVMWPDFSDMEFFDALESYGIRERRFGKTSQQINRMTRKVASYIIKGESQ